MLGRVERFPILRTRASDRRCRARSETEAPQLHAVPLYFEKLLFDPEPDVGRQLQAQRPDVRSARLLCGSSTSRVRVPLVPAHQELANPPRHGHHLRAVRAFPDRPPTERDDCRAEVTLKYAATKHLVQQTTPRVGTLYHDSCGTEHQALVQVRDDEPIQRDTGFVR